MSEIQGWIWLIASKGMFTSGCPRHNSAFIVQKCDLKYRHFIYNNKAVMLCVISIYVVMIVAMSKNRVYSFCIDDEFYWPEERALRFTICKLFEI